MNKIDEILEKQNFSPEEAEIFNEIIKYAKATQASSVKNNLKQFIVQKVEEIIGNESDIHQIQ